MYSLVLRFCSQDIIVKKVESFCRLNGPDYLPGRELTMSLLPQFTLPNGEQVKNLISILQEELVDFFSQDQLGNQIVTLNSIGMKEGQKNKLFLNGETTPSIYHAREKAIEVLEGFECKFKKPVNQSFSPRLNLFSPSNTFSFIHSINKAKNDFEFPITIPALDICLYKQSDYFSHLEGEIVSFEDSSRNFVDAVAL